MAEKSGKRWSGRSRVKRLTTIVGDTWGPGTTELCRHVDTGPNSSAVVFAAHLDRRTAEQLFRRLLAFQQRGCTFEDQL